MNDDQLKIVSVLSVLAAVKTLFFERED